MINYHYTISVSFKPYPFNWAREYVTKFTVNSKEKMDKLRLSQIARDSLDTFKYKGFIIKIPKETIKVDKIVQERSYR